MKPLLGIVVMNDFEQAVEQLKHEVKVVIEADKIYMKPFLKLFGIERSMEYHL